MTTVIVYHKNCFDGICAAWVMSLVYPDAVLVPMAYGEDWRDVLRYYIGPDKYPKLIMVDFSLPRDEMLALAKECDLIVLDHHKAAQAELEGLWFAVFDQNESGASLAWTQFFPDKPMPMLVRYVKDRDLWRFTEKCSEEINAYIQSFS